MILIGCGKEKKENTTCPAGEMYTSNLFAARRKYAETKEPDNWYILSAQYGFTPPFRRIQTYDRQLADMSEVDKAAWYVGVVGQICDRLEDSAFIKEVRIEILASQEYAEPLVDTLLAVGFRTISWPVKGLGIPQQMRWLKEQTRQTEILNRLNNRGSQ